MHVKVESDCINCLFIFQHYSYRMFQGITGLMQISTSTQDYLIDTLLLHSDLCILNDVFADPNIVKVSICSGQV